MKIAYIQCECGKIHHSIPKDARFEKVGPIDVLAWHCTCERSIAVDVKMAELSEVNRIIAHTTFLIRMHILKELNRRSAA